MSSSWSYNIAEFALRHWCEICKAESLDIRRIYKQKWMEKDLISDLWYPVGSHKHHAVLYCICEYHTKKLQFNLGQSVSSKLY